MTDDTFTPAQPTLDIPPERHRTDEQRADIQRAWDLIGHNDETTLNSTDGHLAVLRAIQLGRSLASQPSPAATVEECPRPVIPDHSAQACVESGNCGCGHNGSSAGNVDAMREALKSAQRIIERDYPNGQLAIDIRAALAPVEVHGDGYCGCTERCRDRDNCQYDVKPASISSAGNGEPSLSVQDVQQEFYVWWAANQEDPAHSMITQNCALATWKGAYDKYVRNTKHAPDVPPRNMTKWPDTLGFDDRDKYIDELEAQIERLRAVPQTAGVWQPIETAPRDGSRIVVGRDMGTWGFVRGIARWEDIRGISGWVTTAAFSDPPGVLGLAEPTHWLVASAVTHPEHNATNIT